MGWGRFISTGMRERVFSERGSLYVETYFVTSCILPGQGTFSRGVETQPSTTTYSGMKDNDAGPAD
jgi:hypothetical protein